MSTLLQYIFISLIKIEKHWIGVGEEILTNKGTNTGEESSTILYIKEKVTVCNMDV